MEWQHQRDLDDVLQLKHTLHESLSNCEPRVFQVRDIHNKLVDNITPLLELHTALVATAWRTTGVLKDVRQTAKVCASAAEILEQDSHSSLAIQSTLAELDSALRTLTLTAVDPEFIGGESGHTLYDFVDESSIQSLRTQLASEVGEMDAIKQASTSAISFFEHQMRYLQELLEPVLLVVYPSGVEDLTPIDALALLMSALKQQCQLPGNARVQLVPLQVLMQSWKSYAMELQVSVVSLTSSLSQVENLRIRLLTARERMLDRGSGSNRTTPSPDLQSSDSGSRSTEAPVDQEVSQLLNEFGDCQRIAHDRIRVAHTHTNAWGERLEDFEVVRWCAKATRTVQESTMQKLRGVELEAHRIEKTVAEKQTPFNDGLQRFAALRASVTSIVQELRSLSLFYREFSNAHEALRSEMIRRREAIQKLEQALSDSAQHLAFYHAHEVQRRRAFIEQHGRFLPVSLCPEVQDAAPMFSITPSLTQVLKRIPIPSAQPDALTHKHSRDEDGSRNIQGLPLATEHILEHSHTSTPDMISSNTVAREQTSPLRTRTHTDAFVPLSPEATKQPFASEILTSPINKDLASLELDTQTHMYTSTRETSSSVVNVAVERPPFVLSPVHATSAADAYDITSLLASLNQASPSNLDEVPPSDPPSDLHTHTDVPLSTPTPTHIPLHIPPLQPPHPTLSIHSEADTHIHPQTRSPSDPGSPWTICDDEHAHDHDTSF